MYVQTKLAGRRQVADRLQKISKTCKTCKTFWQVADRSQTGRRQVAKIGKTFAKIGKTFAKIGKSFAENMQILRRECCRGLYCMASGSMWIGGLFCCELNKSSKSIFAENDCLDLLYIFFLLCSFQWNYSYFAATFLISNFCHNSTKIDLRIVVNHRLNKSSKKTRISNTNIAPILESPRVG